MIFLAVFGLVVLGVSEYSRVSSIPLLNQNLSQLKLHLRWTSYGNTVMDQSSIKNMYIIIHFPTIHVFTGNHEIC